MLDLWQFQRNEIEAAELRADEDVELEGERRVQQNAGRLLERRRGFVRGALRIAGIRAVSCSRRGEEDWTNLGKIDEQMAGNAADAGARAHRDSGRFLFTARLSRTRRSEPGSAGRDRDAARSARQAEEQVRRIVAEILAFGEDVARRIAEVENAGERLEELRCELKKLAAAI